MLLPCAGYYICITANANDHIGIEVSYVIQPTAGFALATVPGISLVRGVVSHLHRTGLTIYHFPRKSDVPGSTTSASALSPGLCLCVCVCAPAAG